MRGDIIRMENQFWFLEYDVESNMEGHDFKTFIREVELYYDKNKKLWVNRDEYTGNWYPATFPCHSYRAAKRHLRKHNEIPKGARFRLASRFVGFDRYLVKK